MSEVVKNIALYIGYVTPIITAIVVIYKWFNVVMEGQRCLLRTDIMDIYYKHCEEEEPTLREYERKNLDALYASYVAHRGNSFVSDLYNNVMRHWPVRS